MSLIPCDRRSRAYSEDILDRAQRIRLLALDVDGVLTHGHVTYQSDGQESKTFDTQDGLGLVLLRQHGIELAIITGRTSPMVEHRVKELGIHHLQQGRLDKETALVALAEQQGIPLEACAYCGDDLPDMGAIIRAGLGFSVPNAPSYVQDAADHVTARRGGEGAVREICELLLTAQGHWQAVLTRFQSAAPLQ